MAELLLRCKFYRVLGRRVRTPLGEIDIVARAPTGELCFVEVKARARAEAAAQSLTSRPRERITLAAQLYLGARPRLRHKGVRFDAILVAPGRLPRHLRDAWRPE